MQMKIGAERRGWMRLGEERLDEIGRGEVG
jgi:hypothetical protein